MAISWILTRYLIVADIETMPSEVMWASLLLPLAIAFPTGIIFEHQKHELAQANERLVISNRELEEAQRSLEAAVAELRVKSEQDYLTGIPNRRFFEEKLARLLPRDGNGTVMMVDVDHFKRVNDTFGHDAGDAALQAISTCLRDGIRPDDLLGRYGGEEFAIYLRGLQPQDTDMVASRLREAVEAIDFAPLGSQHRLTISIGGAPIGEASDPRGCIAMADKALYSAKQAGRNRYHYVGDSLVLQAA